MSTWIEWEHDNFSTNFICAESQTGMHVPILMLIARGGVLEVAQCSKCRRVIVRPISLPASFSAAIHPGKPPGSFWMWASQGYIIQEEPSG